jgi:hypothetical protein
MLGRRGILMGWLVMVGWRGEWNGMEVLFS